MDPPRKYSGATGTMDTDRPTSTATDQSNNNHDDWDEEANQGGYNAGSAKLSPLAISTPPSHPMANVSEKDQDHKGAIAKIEPPLASMTEAVSTTLQSTEQDSNEQGLGDAACIIASRPGAFRVFGPGYRNRNEAEDQIVSSPDDNSPVFEFEGYVPEPAPKDQLQEMLRSAIILDDAAVQVVNDSEYTCSTLEDHTDAEGGLTVTPCLDEDEPDMDHSEIKEGLHEKLCITMLRYPCTFITIAVIILLAIGLGLSLRP